MVQGNVLDNGLVRVVIDPKTGDISSLTANKYEFANQNAACALNSYRYLKGNGPLTASSPEIDKEGQVSTSFFALNSQKATRPTEVKMIIKEKGPVLASIQVGSEAEGCNTLSRTISIIAGQPHVEITDMVDKQPVLEKEGIHFGFAFNISDPITRVDIPWGVMELEKDQLKEANRNWIAFQRWLDISNDTVGVTWCSLDAPVFETGNMTANIMGPATNSPEWIRQNEPSATVYSWALNNHWYTNFPLSQEGKIQFRYRILPHNSRYDAGLANRFGLEQSQPLIKTLIKAKFNQKPVLEIKGSSLVSVSILTTNSDGKATQIRLRSVSNKDEQVSLVWVNLRPSKIQLDDTTEVSGNGAIGNDVKVPAMGITVLNVIW